MSPNFKARLVDWFLVQPDCVFTDKYSSKLSKIFMRWCRFVVPWWASPCATSVPDVMAHSVCQKNLECIHGFPTVLSHVQTHTSPPGYDDDKISETTAVIQSAGWNYWTPLLIHTHRFSCCSLTLRSAILPFTDECVSWLLALSTVHDYLETIPGQVPTQWERQVVLWSNILH